MGKLQVSGHEELSSSLEKIACTGLSWSAKQGKRDGVKIEEKLCITNYSFAVNE